MTTTTKNTKKKTGVKKKASAETVTEKATVKAVVENPIPEEFIDTKAEAKNAETVSENVIADAIAKGMEKVVENINTSETLKNNGEKKYKDEDMIPCKSITRGYLSYVGKKSGELYKFANHDDTCDIEVRDLNSLKASKSEYLYEPLFIIEDEEFLAQPKWKDIKEMYDKVIENDIDDIINRPVIEFTSILRNLPVGYRSALVAEVTTRIHNDEFDSIKKIQAIDEVCGTDLYCLLK